MHFILAHIDADSNNNIRHEEYTHIFAAFIVRFHSDEVIDLIFS